MARLPKLAGVHKRSESFASAEGSILDLDFVRDRLHGLERGSYVATRASSGYATTGTGELTWFETNEPRVTDRGLLIEKAATNLVVNSDFKLPEAIRYTSAPDARHDAAVYSGQVVSRGKLILLPSTFYTFSVYVKRVTGESKAGQLLVAEQIDGSMYGQRVSVSTNSYDDERGGWQRLHVTFKTSETIEYARLIVLQDVADQFAIWGAQVELGLLSSLIRTTGSTMTRAEDILSFRFSEHPGQIEVDIDGQKHVQNSDTIVITEGCVSRLTVRVI